MRVCQRDGAFTLQFARPLVIKKGLEKQLVT